MVRILWLLRFPPVAEEKGGDAVYSRNLLRHTALHAEVTALSFTDDPRLFRQAPEWNGVKWVSVGATTRSNLLSLASGLPSIAFRYTRSAFIAEALRLAQTVDVIVLDHIGLVFLAEQMRQAMGSRCPAITLLFHDHGASLRKQMARGAPNPLMRMALALDGLKAAALERRAMRAADGFGAITRTDQALFSEDAGDLPGICVPPGYDGPREAERCILASAPRRIVILGGRTSLHKQIVLSRILDRLVEARVVESVAVDVVGGDPASGGRYPGVNHLGYVDDLAAYMRTVRLGLIPDDVGGGFKLRALSHVFLRVPMLALDQALNGTSLRPEVDYFAAGSLDELVRRIPEIIDDVARLNAVQCSAYDFCAAKFSWRERGRTFAQFLRQRALAKNGPGSYAALS